MAKEASTCIHSIMPTGSRPSGNGCSVSLDNGIEIVPDVNYMGKIAWSAVLPCSVNILHISLFLSGQYLLMQIPQGYKQYGYDK